MKLGVRRATAGRTRFFSGTGRVGACPAPGPAGAGEKVMRRRPCGRCAPPVVPPLV